MAEQKKRLSGSTSGKRIKIAATASPGTTIHTGPISPALLHDICGNLVNMHTGPVDFYLEWGGTTAPDDVIPFKAVPSKDVAQGAEKVFRGVLQGNSTPLIIRGYASVANVITVGGDVIEGPTS